MIKFLLRRILSWIFMIFLATNITYFLATNFLNPRSLYVDLKPPIPADRLDQMLYEVNLNDKTPVLERWWTWLSNIVTHWDWGRSPKRELVSDQVAFRIWVSAELMIGAFILSLIIGIALGVYTASRQYSFADRFLQTMSSIVMNIHIVVVSVTIGTLAIGLNRWLQGLTGNPDFRLFSVVGQPDFGGKNFLEMIVELLQKLLLPTLSLIIISYAGHHLVQRSLLLDNISADYVRTARAKGLTKAEAIRRHALRTSIIPIAVGAAFSLPGIFSGAIMTETIFGWHGMGEYFIKTIGGQDIHGAVAVAAFGALMTAVGAILADVLTVALDPRVRVS